MTKVSITTGGHQIHIEHDGGDLAYVIDKAQKLYDETKPVEAPAGPGYAGFSMERSHATGSGPYGARFEHGDPLPVRADNQVGAS